MTAPARYRPEIDGIRAVAVLSVIWFHAGLSGMRGGFLGVDVFFAISGFLITGIIVRSAEAGGFTLGGFYLRRIRRIIPALLVMCCFTLPFAFWLMLPDDLENYGQSLVATIASANNVLLYLTAGYFALEADYKPLVHTWSLGVEEQYYLIVPLLMAGAVRLRGRSAAMVILAVLTLGSLALAEWLRTVDPNANFYLLPSRFWELGLGGLAALAAEPLRNAVAQATARRLAMLGLLAVLASLFVLGEADNLPGWQSLMPVGGTVLLLVFASQEGAGRLLCLAPMRWIGLISYSAYLYHQPLLSFVRIASLDQPAPALLAATVPVTLLLAWLSWRYVEQPFRDPATASTRQVLSVSLAGSALLGLAGAALVATSGLRARWSELSEGDPLFGARQNAAYVQEPFMFERKPFAGSERTGNMLVLGNSFARDFINMGRETGALAGISVSYEPFEYCEREAWPEAIFVRARQAGSVVLGSGVEARHVACVTEAVRRFEAAGVAHVIVLGTKNFGFNNNAVMLLPAERRYGQRVRPLAETVVANEAGRKAIPAPHYLDLLALMDDGTDTVPVFTPERKFISQDRKHLTKAGARWLGERVFAAPQFAFLQERQ